jgi:transposase
MLLPAAIDDYVSPASPVRAIDAFVDPLDLAASGFKIRTDSSEGRSSYDPATPLKLYLWGYLKRTCSSRGLETACSENLQAIWLTSNLCPDHSTTRSFTKTKIDKLIEGIDKAISRYVTDLAEADEANSSLKSNGLYNNDAFIHDFASNSYSCPQGEVLTRKADTKANAPTGGFRAYWQVGHDPGGHQFRSRTAMVARRRADRSFGVDPRKIIQKSPSNRIKENS